MTVSLPIARRATKCLVPGATAVWDCTKATGTTLPDMSGNGRHGTFGAGAAAPAITPTGLSFDGGDNVAIGALPEIRTLQFVFYVAAPITPASTASYLFGTTIGAANAIGIQFGAATGTLTNEIITVLPDANHRSGWCDAAGSIAAGWHTLAAVYGASGWALTLDGTALPVTAAGGAPATIGASTDAKIGARSLGTSGFTGGIGFGYASPISLTTAQVAQNNAYLKTKFAALGVLLP